MRAMLLAAVVMGPFGADVWGAPIATIDVKGRMPGSTYWDDVLPYVSLQQYEIAVFVSFTEGVALSGARFNIKSQFMPDDSVVQILGPGLGDQTGFDAAAESNAVFWSGGEFRIDHASDLADSASMGLSVAQLPPVIGGGLNSANPALVYRFDVWTGSSPEWWWADISAYEASVQVYTSASGLGSPVDAEVLHDGMRIIVPSPGTLLFACGAVGVSRRRRCARLI